MLVVLRSALGFGQAITEPSAASLLGDHYPPETRGKAFSLQQVMLLAGTGLGVALVGGLAAAFNWRVGLMIAALPGPGLRSEEHTSELQSLMRISYSAFFLTKK